MNNCFCFTSIKTWKRYAWLSTLKAQHCFLIISEFDTGKPYFNLIPTTTLERR